MQQLAVLVCDLERPQLGANEVGHKDVLAEGRVAVSELAPVGLEGLMYPASDGDMVWTDCRGMIAWHCVLLAEGHKAVR